MKLCARCAAAFAVAETSENMGEIMRTRFTAIPAEVRGQLLALHRQDPALWTDLAVLEALRLLEQYDGLPLDFIVGYMNDEETTVSLRDSVRWYAQANSDHIVERVPSKVFNDEERVNEEAIKEMIEDNPIFDEVDEYLRADQKRRIDERRKDPEWLTKALERSFENKSSFY